MEPEVGLDDDGYEFDSSKIPEIVTPDEMNESGYQEGSEQSYGERRDSKEGFGGEGDSDSGVDGVSSGCSVADDCPVVSVNDVVAYYDDIRPRRRAAPLNYYSVDIERMVLDTAQPLPVSFIRSLVQLARRYPPLPLPVRGLHSRARWLHWSSVLRQLWPA
ncbi:unnamed protein product [Plutella xylostella]|uniref:(diamondback moth) hypothetical protein n=1 Tax=Plutella xylostella TaxID=51655 RepID=A0A8S4G8W6_PLUXY|nr:unnamed protein product [Plutella xylostella]